MHYNFTHDKFNFGGSFIRIRNIHLRWELRFVVPGERALYERINLKSYETGAELSKDLTIWFNYYNENRRHTSLDKQTPNEAYFRELEKLNPAA